MLLKFILDWWAAYDQIAVPASVCPVAPNGQAQTANAVLTDWTGLFIMALAIASLVSLVGAFIAYQTRLMGDQFASRWWKGMVATALVAGGAAFAVLITGSVQTFGCQFGNVTTHLPSGVALNRASVALVQACLFYFIWSLVLTRIARVTRHQPWFNNAWYPV